jgi:Polyketide cyclase / dehydrase and lipid transport
MATIIRQIELAANVDKAWAIIRDVGAADLAFPGVLTACRLDGDVRTVTFANGMIVREQIVTVDEVHRRVAYAVIEGGFSHHSASLQVELVGDETCRMIWVSDFLPDDAAAVVAPLVEQGAAALQRAVRADA